MIVALNNKSNLGKEEFHNYLEALKTIETNHKLILCPTFLNASTVMNIPFSLGVQNVSKEENGAFTGEISATQLKSYGVEYAIIGHSERRQYQRETISEIHEKTKKLLAANMKPILCVGETLEERKANKVEEVIRKELENVITDLNEEEQKNIIIAYEPIWAIGTGIVPSNEEIREVFLQIKKLLPNTKVLYGGSANEENIDTLKKIMEIDGYLLGGLSLKPEKLKIFLEKC